MDEHKCETCKNHGTIENRLHELERRMDLRFAYEAEAVKTARVDMERRLESMNEFRAQLERQSATFVSRPEHDQLVTQITMLDRWKSAQEGKASRANQLSIAALFVSVVVVVIELLGGH